MSGKIPPESTLIFNIDLLEIRNGPRSHESFQEMDLNDDWKLSKDEVIFPFSFFLSSFLSFLLSLPLFLFSSLPPFLSFSSLFKKYILK